MIAMVKKEINTDRSTADVSLHALFAGLTSKLFKYTLIGATCK